MKKNFFLRASCSLISFYGILGFILYESGSSVIARETTDEIASIDSADNIKSVNRPKVKKPKLPDRGLPTGRRRCGTSRSECPALDRSLTAIVPGREIKQTDIRYDESHKLMPRTRFSNSESFLTRTLKEYPSFWIYVPELADTSYEAEFILQDDEDRDIYRASFNLPSKSGIFEIKLPPQPPHSLKIGQKYHWYVKIFCGNEREKSGYIFVDAWIERIAAFPQLQRQLNQKNADRARILIEHNIWHDAIDYLARFRQNNLSQDRWDRLLTNLSLSDLIDKRILDIRANFPTK